MTDFLLVPSPLLGPATWQPVADWLREKGESVTVVAIQQPVRTPVDVLESMVRAGAGLRDIVLVPHSNAGLYAPALAERLRATAIVFVDAAIAGDGHDTALAPPGFLALVQELADRDGLLPPWTEWWDDLTGLFPDAGSRAAVEAEQSRLPLSYFTSRVDVPPRWSEGHCAYLAFGETYAGELEYAVAHGWPTAVLEARHLHALHDPAAVGAAILALAASIRE